MTARNIDAEIRRDTLDVEAEQATDRLLPALVILVIAGATCPGQDAGVTARRLCPIAKALQ